MTETKTKYRKKQPRGTFGTIMAWAWSAVYVYLGVFALTDIASSVSVTDLVILSVFVLLALRTAIEWEFSGKWWTRWQDYKGEKNGLG